MLLWLDGTRIPVDPNPLVKVQAVNRHLIWSEGKLKSFKRKTQDKRWKCYRGVLSKWEFFIKMRAAFLASILPWVMKEGESKEGSSHFDEKGSIHLRAEMTFQAKTFGKEYWHRAKTFGMIWYFGTLMNRPLLTFSNSATLIRHCFKWN